MNVGTAVLRIGSFVLFGLVMFSLAWTPPGRELGRAVFIPIRDVLPPPLGIEEPTLPSPTPAPPPRPPSAAHGGAAIAPVPFIVIANPTPEHDVFERDRPEPTAAPVATEPPSRESKGRERGPKGPK